MIRLRSIPKLRDGSYGGQARLRALTGWLILATLLVATPAWASISLVQSQSARCATTTSCTVSLPSSTTSGNLLVFGLQWGGQSGTITACDGGSCSTTCATSTDTWNTVPSNPESDGASGGSEVNVAYAKAAGALTSFTYCVSGGGSHSLRIGAYEYSSTTGWPALASILDTSNVNNSSTGTTSGNPGNVTPAANGELLFSAIEFGTGTVSSITVSGTGMVHQPTANGSSSTGWGSAGKATGCDNENSGNTSTTCTFSWTTSSAYAATIAAFKPSGGATAPKGFNKRKKVENLDTR